MKYKNIEITNIITINCDFIYNTLSVIEKEKLMNGFIAQSMDDHWNIFLRDMHLWLCTSWGDNPVYIFKFFDNHTDLIVNIDAFVNGNKYCEEYYLLEAKTIVYANVFGQTITDEVLEKLEKLDKYSNHKLSQYEEKLLLDVPSIDKKKLDNDLKGKLFSSLFGFAVGDALGVPVEFYTRKTIHQKPVLTMRGYETHNQPPGTWSDDSSLMFCLMESLLNGYCLGDIAQNMMKWLYEGYWTPFGKVFDVGLSTKKSISKIRRGISPSETGGSGVYDNGNGGLMRILPLVFFLKSYPKNDKFRIIKEVSSITHSHSVSVIGAQLYVLLGQYILKGNSVLDSYKKSSKEIFEYYKNSEYKKSLLCYKRLLFENIGSLPVGMIKSSGYVVDTLEAIIWSLLNSDSYKKAVLLAVNLGEDTDTIGALTGGLAGLKYGYNEIPEGWINQLARKSDIEELIERFGKSLI